MNDGKHRNIEPAMDPDSAERLDEERPDAPHGPSRFDAGTGRGTVLGPPAGEFQERPILDGSTMSADAEASVPNPNRGQADPALVHNQPALTSASTNRWMFSAVAAFVVVGAVLLLLARWDPLWCSIGLAVGLIGLLGMLVVRATGLRRPARLWVDAGLLAMIWLVPLAIIVSVVVGHRDRIW
ncbi:hypothetical protein ACFPZL_07250 [Leucobacter soli]|uniref:Uncharacterized protein n=1 Tax=Leucobacter soli TaxID=2812850 RepID=A0A916NNC9_9MICO|nr:hypothetical protein [Leucobacter soli]CAG7612125.1 hypothetical protein LEUCIP111803_01533 [Leucobacter soli]